MWIRCKDPGTGHEFDIPEGDPALDRLALVDQDRWPPAHTARPPKHHLDLAGQSVTRPESPRPVTARKSTKKEH